VAATLLSIGSHAGVLGMGAPFFFSSGLFALSSVIAHVAFSFWAPPPSGEEDGIEGEPLVEGIAKGNGWQKRTCDESKGDDDDDGDDIGRPLVLTGI
jgi:hypothetical protein